MTNRKCNICGGGLHYDWPDYYRGKYWYVHATCDNLRRKEHRLFAEGDNKLDRDRRGFVYVVINPAWPDLCKIGFSHNPRGRIASANTWCPDSAFEIHETIYAEDAQMLEGLVHVALKNRRRHVNGEWFEINRWHAANLIRKVKKDVDNPYRGFGSQQPTTGSD